MKKISNSDALALVEALLAATLRNKKESQAARTLAAETLALTCPETALSIVAEGVVPREICLRVHALLDLNLSVVVQRDAA